MTAGGGARKDGRVALPPMLSPTLPPEWEGVDDVESEFPEKPLSPTLPSLYEVEPAAPRALVVRLKYRRASHTAEVTKLPPAKKRTKNVRDYSSSPEEPGSVNGTPMANGKDIKTERATRKVSDAEMPPEYRALRAQLGNWADLARQKKHQADAAVEKRQHHLAALSSIDSVICFIRAFDCEDRACVLARRGQHIRSWKTLAPYLDKLATYLESVDADIAGVCYLVRAVVYMHMANVVRKAKLAGELTLDAAFVKCIADFKRGLSLLPTHSIQQKYGLNWTANRRNAEVIDPVRDQCCLPLHVNTTIQDAAAFAYNLTSKWAAHESIEYTWAATK